MSVSRYLKGKPLAFRQHSPLEVLAMIASPQPPNLTPNEYLQMEDVSNIKHEYIDGQVYAMALGSDSHVTIAGNLFALLRNHVRGSGCRVYIADMKARIVMRSL
jgi:Uma2 family endonuclease